MARKPQQALPTTRYPMSPSQPVEAKACYQAMPLPYGDSDTVILSARATFFRSTTAFSCKLHARGDTAGANSPNNDSIPTSGERVRQSEDPQL